MILLKEVYAEMFQETRFDGILFEIANALMAHDWAHAKEAISEAREMKVPEGIIQDVISNSFKEHASRFSDLQSQMLGH